ncbi:MAG: hypothetical protein OXQ28_12965 [Acidobacteriota bacterium]|nr:hypothetical protein [Acidobacteriota bacterium]
MIWTDRYGHEWDLDNCGPCRRCGQDRPGRFDSTCMGKRDDAEPAVPFNHVPTNAREER